LLCRAFSLLADPLAGGDLSEVAARRRRSSDGFAA
jgi:hypothetical protein